MTSFDRAAELFEELADLDEGERDAALVKLQDEPEVVLGLLRQMLGSENTPTPLLDGAGTYALNVGGSLPETIGPFRILGLLGEGGMGRVFEAQQADPARRVALKVIRGPLATESQRRRFATEAQALAWLNHPGIATVYETGTAELRGEQCPYLAMERVEGEALDAYLVNHAPNLSTRIELIARICDAVHHAHEQGVVHRDLKPANVLVDATGRPKVLDFGIARLADQDGAQTQTGQLIGTLAYMSPEQFGTKGEQVDLRADVYALGVLLYEALSGRRPFELAGLPLHEAARVVAQDDPPALGALDQRLAGDLETIAAKALEGDRSRRYASAGELAADLRRFLEHEPIAARPRTTAYKLRKFVLRNRWLVAGSASTLAAILLGLVGTLSFAVHADARAEQALDAREAALRSASEARAAQERARKAASEARAEELEAQQRKQVAEAVRDLFLGVLNAARPTRAQGREVTVLEALDAALETLEDEPIADSEVELATRLMLSRVLASLDENDAGIVQGERALELARQVHGHDSLEVRRIMLVLGGTYLSAGRKADFERSVMEVLEGGPLLGEGPMDDAVFEDYVALGHLANTEHKAGNFDRAVELSERSIEGLRRTMPPGSAALLQELHRLSSHYMFTGDRELELATATEAYELGQAYGFENLPRPLLLYEQLANALDDIGRTEEALPIYEEAIQKSSTWYGPDHVVTAGLEFNLSLALMGLGRTDESIPLAIRAHKHLSAGHGPSARDTMLALRAALASYAIAGRHDEGLMWSEPFVHGIPDNYAGWMVQMVRGQMLTQLGVHEEAIELCAPAYEKASRILRPGNGHLVNCLKALILSSKALGLSEDAERFDELLQEHLAAGGSQ